MIFVAFFISGCAITIPITNDTQLDVRADIRVDLIHKDSNSY
jgi:hypothetical protein